LIDRLVDIYDEPFADSSALPTYQVCGLGREFVTVALSGDGGDEVFGGYNRYRWHLGEQRLRRWLPQSIRGPLFGALGSRFPPLYGAPRVFRGKASLMAMSRDTADGYAHLMSILPIDQRQALYSADMRATLGGYDARELIRQTMRDAPADNDLDRVQYTDMMTYLPGDILTKVDRASMAHALEVRVPLLDHPFVEWAAGISPAMKLRNGEGKAIFKKALESLLPRDLLYRTKMGFAVPVSEWFRGPLRPRLEQALNSAVLRGSGMIDSDAGRRLLTCHLSRQVDYSAGLWALLMFEAFLRTVHTRPTWQPQQAAARDAVSTHRL
jgi:asparagine synthase (glutamine-hydrolysing)